MAVNWSNFHLIDNYEFNIVGNIFDNSAIGRFWALATDVDSSKLPVAGESPPTSLSTGTWYVDRCQAVANDPKSYTVTVYFRNYLYLPVSVVRGSASELTAQVKMAHDTGSFYISPRMMGLRPIQKADKPVFTGVLKNWIPLQKDATTGNPITEAQWNADSNVPEECPFTRRPADNLVGKTLQCSVVICIAYVTKASVPSTAFNGVNSTSNIPSGYDMDNRTTAGMWRAQKQRTSNLLTREGTAYRRVKRWLVHPPSGGDNDGNHLVWDSSKCGGTFTW